MKTKHSPAIAECTVISSDALTQIIKMRYSVIKLLSLLLNHVFGFFRQMSLQRCIQENILERVPTPVLKYPSFKKVHFPLNHSYLRVKAPSVHLGKLYHI